MRSLNLILLCVLVLPLKENRNVESAILPAYIQQYKGRAHRISDQHADPKILTDTNNVHDEKLASEGSSTEPKKISFSRSPFQQHAGSLESLNILNEKKHPVHISLVLPDRNGQIPESYGYGGKEADAETSQTETTANETTTKGSEETPEEDKVVIIAVASGFVAVISLIIVIVCCRVRKQNREHKRSNSNSRVHVRDSVQIYRNQARSSSTNGINKDQEDKPPELTTAECSNHTDNSSPKADGKEKLPAEQISSEKVKHSVQFETASEASTSSTRKMSEEKISSPGVNATKEGITKGNTNATVNVHSGKEEQSEGEIHDGKEAETNTGQNTGKDSSSKRSSSRGEISPQDDNLKADSDLVNVPDRTRVNGEQGELSSSVLSDDQETERKLSALFAFEHELGIASSGDNLEQKVEENSSKQETDVEDSDSRKSLYVEDVDNEASVLQKSTDSEEGDKEPNRQSSGNLDKSIEAMTLQEVHCDQQGELKPSEIPDLIEDREKSDSIDHSSKKEHENESTQECSTKEALKEKQEEPENEQAGKLRQKSENEQEKQRKESADSPETPNLSGQETKPVEEVEQRR